MSRAIAWLREYEPLITAIITICLAMTLIANLEGVA